METLEKILRIACSGLILLGSSRLKADPLDYVDPQSVNIVTSSSETIGKSTICENYIAWEQGGNVYAKNRTTSQEYLIGPGSNPNLDSVSGNKLVYDRNGSVYMYNLETLTNQVVYQKVGTEVCSNPKINGENLVFRLYSDTIGKEFGWIVKYNLEEGVPYPITESLNEKTQADTFGRYVIWTEKEANIAYPGQFKFSNHLYDLVRGTETTLADNFVTNDLASSAVYGNKVVSVANSSSWAGGPTSLVVHDLSEYSSNPLEGEEAIGTGVVSSSWGSKDQVAMYGNLAVWTEVYKGGYISGVDTTSKMSIEQFTIAGPGCYNPDVYVDSNGDYNVIYMSETGPTVEGGFSTMSDPNEKFLLQAKIKSYGREDIKECGDRGTVYLPGDLNKDCYVDISDLGIITANWLEEGLGQNRPIDGNDLNLDPQNWRYDCEVGPEMMINDQRVSLDFNGDCRTSLYEFQRLAENWMKCTDPANDSCDPYWEYQKQN
jgi:hypothetical protein